MMRRQRGYIINPFMFSSGGSDPYFSQVVELIHFDGSDGTTTMSAVVGKQFTQQQANAKLSTTQQRFGTASLYSDSAGLAQSDTSYSFRAGTSDFVLEGWFRMNSVSGSKTVLDTRLAGSNGAYSVVYVNAGALTYYVDSADRISGGTITASTWWYWAVARDSGTTRLYAGTSGTASLIGSWSDSTNYNAMSFYSFGKNVASGGGGEVAGYTDEFRASVGTSRGYTGSSISVPTSAFPDS